jgi:hypothetical protein
MDHVDPSDRHAPFIVPPPDWPSTIRLFQTPHDEQREQIRQAMANVTAGLRQITEALGPAAATAAKQLEELGEQLPAASSHLPDWADTFAYKPGGRG